MLCIADCFTIPLPPQRPLLRPDTPPSIQDKKNIDAVLSSENGCPTKEQMECYYKPLERYTTEICVKDFILNHEEKHKSLLKTVQSNTGISSLVQFEQNYNPKDNDIFFTQLEELQISS